MTPAAVEALPFIVACLIGATALSFVLTPLAIRFARPLGAIDAPDAARRVHQRPIPRAGGLAVVGAFLLVGGAAIGINDVLDSVQPLRANDGRGLLVLFGGVAVAAAIGFLDDRYQLRARWQLLGQLALASLVVSAGVTINFINNPFGGPPIQFNHPSSAFPFAEAITVLWVVGMINSINFIDGLDGLSSGISLIAAVTLGVISLTVALDQPFVALLCAILAGALAGFLPWNFHPARIFIGTTGVFAVGFALAVLSILGTAKIAVALLVLGVPIIDTFWIIVRRVLEGQSPFTPDRGHFHHRLLDLGVSHRGAVVLIYALGVGLAVLSFLLSGSGQLYAFLGIVLGGGLVLYLMTRRAAESFEAESYEEDASTEAAGRRVPAWRRLPAAFGLRRRGRSRPPERDASDAPRAPRSHLG